MHQGRRVEFTDERTRFAPAPVNDPIHMAFLMNDDEFDRGYNALTTLAVDHWADPQMTRPGEISTDEGKRVYLSLIHI